MSTLTLLGSISNNTTGKPSSPEGSQSPWCQRENALKVHFLKQVFPRSHCSCLPLQPSWDFPKEEKSVVIGRQCLQEAAQWALFLLTVWFASRITQLWGSVLQGPWCVTLWRMRGPSMTSGLLKKRGYCLQNASGYEVRSIRAVKAPAWGSSWPIMANVSKSLGLVLCLHSLVFHITGHLAYVREAFLCDCTSCTQTITIF